jgi:hypothetical protein
MEHTEEDNYLEPLNNTYILCSIKLCYYIMLSVGAISNLTILLNHQGVMVSSNDSRIITRNHNPLDGILMEHTEGAH